MVNSYTNTSQSLAANQAIPFLINDVLTGCTVTHDAGSTTFVLNKPGFYQVNFNGTGAVSGVASGPVTVTLYNNGSVVPGATATQTSASTTDIRTVNFTRLIRVLPSCPVINNKASLVFTNTGDAATFSNVNVVITKLA